MNTFLAGKLLVPAFSPAFPRHQKRFKIFRREILPIQVKESSIKLLEFLKGLLIHFVKC